MRKLLLVLLFPVLISAQDTRGRITGRVTDSSGAVVPGAAVRVTNPETNIAVSATTNAQGAYDLPYLLPGVYTLAAEFPGFKKYERDGIAVRVNDQLTIDLALQPGSVSETVTVTAETPILEEAAALGQVVDSKRITELPLSGGNAYTLTVLTTGVMNFAPLVQYRCLRAGQRPATDEQHPHLPQPSDRRARQGHQHLERVSDEVLPSDGADEAAISLRVVERREPLALRRPEHHPDQHGVRDHHRHGRLPAAGLLRAEAALLTTKAQTHEEHKGSTSGSFVSSCLCAFVVHTRVPLR
jgi:hypothetical protein